jgi:hypothetical protein
MAVRKSTQNKTRNAGKPSQRDRCAHDWKEMTLSRLTKCKVGTVYLNRLGESVRVICNDRVGEFPVVGLKIVKGREQIFCYLPNGMFTTEPMTVTNEDLIFNYTEREGDKPTLLGFWNPKNGKTRYFKTAAELNKSGCGPGWIRQPLLDR